MIAMLSSMTEQLIAYVVWAPGQESEQGHCTQTEWETKRKREVNERWAGTGYKVSVWPPQKWWRRGNNA